MKMFLKNCILLLLCIYVVEGQITDDRPSCGCCPSKECREQSIPCSSNVDCDCLFMTMTFAGMCADTLVSCQSLTPCESDNITCSIPNTVCVNNTRCRIPVCYPIALASTTRCPPILNSTRILPIQTTIPSTSSSTRPTTSTVVITSPTTSISLCTPYLYNRTFVGCQLNQTLITFDDYSSTCSETQVVGEYARFLWTNAGILHAALYRNGYGTAVTSGQYVLFNWSAQPMNITSSSGSRFNLNSFIASSAWRDNLNVAMRGFRSGLPVYSQNFILSINNRTNVALNWINIDTFNLVSTYSQVAIDNMCVTY